MTLLGSHAVHCFYEETTRIPDSEVTVGCGLHRKRAMNSDPNAQTMTGVTVMIHENYKPSGYDWDIAVIQLPSALTFNKYVQPVCLPSTPAADGTNCVVTGWGNTENTGSDKVLRQVVVPTINWNTCKNINYKYRTFLTSNMMCAGPMEGGKDSCSGDSGGPLVCKAGGRWWQNGIVSWGWGCADTNKPGIYASVTELLQWIRQQTGIGASARKNGKDIVKPATTESPINPLRMNDELNAAEKELLHLLRLKFSDKDKKSAALKIIKDIVKPPTTTLPPMIPVEEAELNAAEKELLHLLRHKFADSDDENVKDIVKPPTTTLPPMIPAEMNELDAAEKELLGLLRLKKNSALHE